MDQEKTEYPQKDGIIKSDQNTAETLYIDTFGIKTFTDLTSSIIKKIAPEIRKKILETYLANNEHETFDYKTPRGKKTNIWIIEGARHDATEFHIAEKLARSGQHVLFPNHGALGDGRKNDVYLYDAKTYLQQKVELKALFGETAEALKSQIISGSGQASVIAYDIQSNIKRNWLIDGLRGGWGKDTKIVLLNWKGQWYEINREYAYKKGWLENTLK
jgi:hypothetical protein